MDFKKIEKKWQSKWEKTKIFEVNEGKKRKFFVNVPYPYMNAYLHLGHFYTWMRADAFARYKRMQGFNVLFPQGWHCTGSPIISVAKRIEEGEEKQIKAMKEMGFSDEEIKKFTDPVYWIKTFPKETEKDFRNMGFSIDWRRSFITTYLNPYYDKFIRWQFNKLREKGYIVKGKHPVVWCAKDNSPVGDHDRVEGEGETPQEFTLLKFKYNDFYLIAATLRPETIFGQTNLWVDSRLEYVKAKVNNEVWIISKECSDKLKEQDKKVEIIGKIKGKELIGKYVIALGIDKKIIILPSYFCDPAKGTGIVTSVPSDAPDDYIGLYDLQANEEECKKYNLNYKEVKKIKIIPIIKSEEFGELSAVKICQDLGIKNQHEREKLERAKKIVYKKGFYAGVMNENCGKYVGMQVEKAKDLVKKELIDKKKADVMYELTGKVVCRCLTPSIVKIVADQWFLKYSDLKWKKLSHKALKKMRLYPEKSREQFEYTIDWLTDWACTREFGLGTKLPWDENWVIESLSDSTIYMAYYTIAHLIKDIPIEKINDKFFDYVFLGKGKLNIKNIDKLRKEFAYWYPFDFRNSGKDLIQNHLTFCIFNHTAIFPEKYWPNGISVNGWVRVEGQKMSKSLGNFILIRSVLKDFSADTSRITVLSGGESLDDPNWSSDFAKNIKVRLEQFYEFSVKNYNKGVNKVRSVDKWMEHQLNEVIKDTTSFMEETLFRSAIQKAYFDLQKSLRWYLRRIDKPNKRVINKVIETQILLLSPFVPHLCEELWSKIGKKEFVSLAKWPETAKAVYKGNEEYIKKVLDDINSILKIIKFKPKKIYLYTIPSEKKLLAETKDFFEKEFDMKFFIFSSSDKNMYDPQQKSRKAVKGKVAIFVE